MLPFASTLLDRIDQLVVLSSGLAPFPRLVAAVQRDDRTGQGTTGFHRKTRDLAHRRITMIQVDHGCQGMACSLRQLQDGCAPGQTLASRRLILFQIATEQDQVLFLIRQESNTQVLRHIILTVGGSDNLLILRTGMLFGAELRP